MANRDEVVERTLWRLDNLDENPEWIRNLRYRTTAKNANLVSSLLENGMHAPAIDLDIPVRLFPSSTEGHHHLYIDKPLIWRQYRIFLRALYRAGLIGKGYYLMSVYRGSSFLRRPGVFKAKKQPRTFKTLIKWIVVVIPALLALIKWNVIEFIEKLKDDVLGIR